MGGLKVMADRIVRISQVEVELSIEVGVRCMFSLAPESLYRSWPLAETGHHSVRCWLIKSTTHKNW